MAVSTWKFVDQPVSTPATLLDMHDGNTWRTLGDDGFDISPPPLRRTVASNSLTDGGLVTSASYDLREIKFTVRMSASTEDGRNQQLKDLEAELSKPANLLMYQAKNSSFPVFFRTFRSDAFDFDKQTGAEQYWDVKCSLLAEPFAIGVRHDIVTGASVTNDPASGTNPSRLDITGIRGDSPSPAFARVGTSFGANATFVVAQRTINNPTALTSFAQCEAGTQGTDTTTQANDATMSGAGNNFSRTTFATNTLITRVTVTVPTATSAEALRGRYRVYVKVRRAANSSEFNMRWQVAGSDTVTGPTVTYSASLPNTFFMDLGVLELPAQGPAPPTIGYSGLSAGFQSVSLAIQAQRLSGAQNLDMDFVYLVPADERLCAFNQVASTGYICLDGPQDMTYGMATGTSPFDPSVANRTVANGGGLIPRIGGLPMLVPGTTNRWYILRTSFAVTATSTWDVSYWPRWREVATS